MRHFGFCLTIVGLCLSFTQVYAFYLSGDWPSFDAAYLLRLAGLSPASLVESVPLFGTTALLLSLEVCTVAIIGGALLAILAARSRVTAPQTFLDFKTTTSIALVVVAGLIVGVGVAGLGNAMHGTTVGAVAAATRPA